MSKEGVISQRERRGATQTVGASLVSVRRKIAVCDCSVQSTENQCVVCGNSVCLRCLVWPKRYFSFLYRSVLSGAGVVNTAVKLSHTWMSLPHVSQKQMIEMI
jgi:hypothetical protein